MFLCRKRAKCIILGVGGIFVRNECMCCEENIFSRWTSILIHADSRNTSLLSTVLNSGRLNTLRKWNPNFKAQSGTKKPSIQYE